MTDIHVIVIERCDPVSLSVPIVWSYMPRIFLVAEKTRPAGRPGRGGGGGSLKDEVIFLAKTTKHAIARKINKPLSGLFPFSFELFGLLTSYVSLDLYQVSLDHDAC